MDRISIAKTLLKYIGRDSVENDWAIAQGVIVILEGSQPEHSQPMEAKAAPEEPKKPKKTEPKRKPFDTGKLGALRRAGWSVEKIADEMQVSEATVYKYMKQEGIA